MAVLFQTVEKPSHCEEVAHTGLGISAQFTFGKEIATRGNDNGNFCLGIDENLFSGYNKAKEKPLKLGKDVPNEA